MAKDDLRWQQAEQQAARAEALKELEPTLNEIICRLDNATFRHLLVVLGTAYTRKYDAKYKKGLEFDKKFWFKTALPHYSTEYPRVTLNNEDVVEKTMDGAYGIAPGIVSLRMGDTTLNLTFYSPDRIHASTNAFQHGYFTYEQVLENLRMTIEACKENNDQKFEEINWA